MPELNGGCLCGAVRYTSNSAPEFIGVCHCRDCQKYTGSAFAIMVGLRKTALQIRGPVKTFSKLGDSGKPILRHFCPECGSSIADEPSRRPGAIILNAGTLDDPSSVMPTLEIYCDRALPWVQLAGGMQRNRRGATGSTALGAGRAIPGAKAEWPQRVSDSTSYGEQRTPGHPSSPSVSFQR